MKTCNKCNIDKSLDNFYNHKKSPDGKHYMCKDCAKKKSLDRYSKLSLDREYKDKEAERILRSYYKNGRKNKNKAIIRNSYILKYPEKYLAKKRCDRLLKKEGFHLHHWSYNEQHYLDVIEIEVKSHHFLHRYLIYDSERMMYRRYDTNELLDSKEKHIEFIEYILKRNGEATRQKAT